MHEMKAAVLREVNTPVTIETITVDDPGPGEVLIATAAAGVCHSDYHFMNGSHTCQLPVVPGHESAGVIEAVGPGVDYVKPGDHVITCMSMSCGECRFCVAGRTVLCEGPGAARLPGESSRLSSEGTDIGQLYDLASYGEKMLVSERAVVKIRDDMPLDRAALIGCAVITGYGAVVNTASVPMGASTAIIGCGGDDELEGGAGRDILLGGRGGDVARGGAGLDVCRAETRSSCRTVLWW